MGAESDEADTTGMRFKGVRCEKRSEQRVMRRYSVLGISLMDFSAREGLRRAEHFLQTGALNTTSYINAQSLSVASRDEQVKEYLEETDLMFCLEPDILEAAGIASPGRVREIEDRMFLREFLKRLARQHDKVYLLGDTGKQAQELQEMLLNAQENLNIVDVRGYEEFEYQPQRLMNAMNEAAPKVIFSRMTYPLDLELMHSGRKFLNAELWVALPETKLKEKVRTTFWRKVRKKIFQKKVNEYNLEKAEQ